MAVSERLSAFVVANPGMSLSSAANRLVDEAAAPPQASRRLEN
jgi:hypothetical protein